MVGTDWSGEHHDYRDTVMIYGCVSPALGGRVSLVTNGTGVQVRPDTVTIDPSGSGIIAFRVTVSQDASAGLRIQHHGGGEDDISGPLVAADGDGWHFVPHSQ
ncbi:hypothetical protein [Terrabacter terrae]|uniref:hypothetical protein n=1 Tax=Terrabacter terrae TaxID=318434 RepID=UPI0031DEE84F